MRSKRRSISSIVQSGGVSRLSCASIRRGWWEQFVRSFVYSFLSSLLSCTFLSSLHYTPLNSFIDSIDPVFHDSSSRIPHRRSVSKGKKRENKKQVSARPTPQLLFPAPYPAPMTTKGTFANEIRRPMKGKIVHIQLHLPPRREHQEDRRFVGGLRLGHLASCGMALHRRRSEVGSGRRNWREGEEDAYGLSGGQDGLGVVKSLLADHAVVLLSSRVEWS
jgi:hypothetical protein